MKVMWFLTYDTVRKVCIDNDFYNAGNNEEYENMFSKVAAKEDNGFALEDVVEIAEDIAEHTGREITTNFVTERLLNAAYTAVV